MGAKRQEELQRQLEAERQKLTDEQRADLDRFSAGLKESNTYKIEYELKAAKIIRTEEGHHRRAQLHSLTQDAERQGILEQREAFAEADKQKGSEARDAETLKVTEALREAQAATPERLQQQFGRYDALRQPPTPPNPNTPELPSKAQEQGGQRPEQSAPQEVVSWDAWKASVERNNPEIGRYDELKRLSEQQAKDAPAPIIAELRAAAHEVCDPKTAPSPPSRNADPQPPTPPTPPRGPDGSGPPPHNGPRGPETPPSTSPNTPLSASEVLQRFNDPALQARYQQDQQRREQDTKSSLYSADTVTRSAARAGASGDGLRDTALMSAFTKAETKRKVEEEQAVRANDPSRTMGRGR